MADSGNPTRKQGLGFESISVIMLFLIMLSLILVFLGGLAIMAGKDKFEATDIVAILAPVLATIGTVSAGVFGYSLGSRGAAEAQQVAVAATQKEAALLQAAETQISKTERIVAAARAGVPPAEGKRLMSEDDLDTLLDMPGPFGRRLGATEAVWPRASESAEPAQSAETQQPDE